MNDNTNTNSPVGPVTPSYTGVISPDGGIRVDLAHFVPRPDTLAALDWPVMAKRIDSIIIEISRKGSVETLGKQSIENISNIFDQISYTLRLRLAKGDFDV